LRAARAGERVPESGGLGSTQEAELTVARERFEALSDRDGLERLGLAYWSHLARVTLGLIRVYDAPTGPIVALLARPLALLRFAAPAFVAEPGRGAVTWQITGGLLVARRGRGHGFLRIAVASAHGPHAVAVRLRVRLEVGNYYPWLRGRGRFARLGVWLYARTQLRIHVAVCNAFLRSLRRRALPGAPV